MGLHIKVNDLKFAFPGRGELNIGFFTRQMEMG
jgi:hypothetical protein